MTRPPQLSSSQDGPWSLIVDGVKTLQTYRKNKEKMKTEDPLIAGTLDRQVEWGGVEWGGVKMFKT